MATPYYLTPNIKKQLENRAKTTLKIKVLGNPQTLGILAQRLIISALGVLNRELK